MQQYAGIYLLQKLLYNFRVSSHPSSEVHKTVTAASGTGYVTYQGNNLLPAWPHWQKVFALICDLPVPEAAVTVLCTPDDGCDDTRNM